MRLQTGGSSSDISIPSHFTLCKQGTRCQKLCCLFSFLKPLTCIWTLPFLIRRLVLLCMVPWVLRISYPMGSQFSSFRFSIHAIQRDSKYFLWLFCLLSFRGVMISTTACGFRGIISYMICNWLCSQGKRTQKECLLL